MDVIWNSAFGIDIDCQNEFENLFLERGVKHFKDLAEFKFLHLINREPLFLNLTTKDKKT